MVKEPGTPSSSIPVVAKLTNDRYPRFVSGYHVIALKAASPHQGGIAVLWKPGHWDFEVEAVHVASPNILTFQLVTGGV